MNIFNCFVAEEGIFNKKNGKKNIGIETESKTMHSRVKIYMYKKYYTYNINFHCLTKYFTSFCFPCKINGTSV